MLHQDRFVKVMLVVIAVLLALNLLKPVASPSLLRFETPAQAQVQKRQGDSVKLYDVKPVRGYEVVDLKELVALGDGKSFVVSTPNKFMVYQLDSF